MTISVRTPSGRILSQEFSTRPFKSDGFADWHKKAVIEKRGNKDVAVIYFDLEPNNEAGTYMIESVTANKMLEDTNAGGRTLAGHHPRGKRTEVKLLERGIRKTVAVYRKLGKIEVERPKD